MILLIGYENDSNIKYLSGELKSLTKFQLVSLKDFFTNGNIRYNSSRPENTILYCNNISYPFSVFTGIYLRLTLPGPSHFSDSQWPRVVSIYNSLVSSLLSNKIKIANPPFSGWENMSKPLQTKMLKDFGFNVPLSLTTSIPKDFISFSKNKAVIYKSNSGVRSIVEKANGLPLERIESLKNCPVFFQEKIDGFDVRIHTVNGNCFAVKAESDAIDYRYFRKRGSYCNLSELHEIPKQIEDLCINYAKNREIIIAGFDFKVDKNNTWYCLEMNPMPAFESYDIVLNQKITRSLIQYFNE